ncbi:MAG: DNA-binding protein [Candidatus Symbiothrix sp.]|jgi:hypothetical protein|nr:DNA-binding protein [Candidatus Symbiothrix sp.]
MKTVKVIVERGKDGMFSANMDYYDFDFGLSGFGNTSKEALQDFYECYEEAKKMCSAEGKNPPELAFEIEYDVSSFLNYYSGILSKSGLEKITGISQKQLWHYSSGTKRPTPKTREKIQTGLRSFAKDLSQVSFID